MSQSQNQKGVIIGNILIVIMAVIIIGVSLSVWAKPYASAKDTSKAIIGAIADTTKTLVVTNNFETALVASEKADTSAINAAFLQQMREKGELLSSDEFASRITDYYNTLVAVLAAVFVLFTLVTYITLKSKFEGKFEDKARELEDKQRVLEDKQREKIVDELRSMLNDSRRIDEVIQSAIGGRIDDNIAKKEDVDDLFTNVEANRKNIFNLMQNVDDIKKKQQELFKVVEDLQDQVADGTTVQQDVDTE